MQLEQLNQWIEAEKPEIEAALKHFVEINTYTANAAGVDEGMDELSRMAQRFGFHVEAINGRHRLIRGEKGTAKPRVMLISHMDTVHAPDSDFKTYTRHDDGFAYGPGVGDIKGGMIMGLWAMRALTDLLDAYNIEMIVSADEENGSPTLRDWYMGGHTGADYAIGLEPGFPQGPLTPDVALGVVEKRRGYGAIRFTVRGKDAHSGEAHKGLNALEAAAQRITRIHALNDRDAGISTTVGMLNGGSAPNTVPGKAVGTASARYETLADGQQVMDQIREILLASYMHNPEIDLRDSAEIEDIAVLPPMERSERNRVLVDVVLEEAERLGHNVVPIARGGGSDASFVSGSGTPAICGMGAPAEGIHTTNEKIYLPMLFERVNLLTSTVYRLYERGIMPA